MIGKCESVKLIKDNSLLFASKIKAIDFFGAALALGGSTVLVVRTRSCATGEPPLTTSQLALTWAGSEYEWNSAHVIATLIVGFLFCVFFVLWQWRGTSVPLVPCKSVALLVPTVS